MEYLKIGITVAAFVLSFLAFMFTRRSWFESNRSIVSAEIITHASGNVGMMFNLVIHNTGNRPATDIRLYASEKVLESAINPNAPEPLKKDIRCCFSNEGVIPILHHGRSVSNGFGNTNIDETESTLIYKSTIPVTIKYSDLNGRSYKTEQELIVKDSTYFAGSGWAE